MGGYEDLVERLRRQGFAEALRHFEQASSALGRSEWEAANSQVRSALESLFNEVANLKLEKPDRGGAARKALENAGILRSEEAALMKSFMAVANGAGAHAGTSNEDEALGRFLAGIGIGFLGLALVPELVLVQDIVIGQLTPPQGSRLPTDQEILTECPTCNTSQTLAEAVASRDGDDTIYTCRHGCQVVVAIGAPGAKPWSGRGYRLGRHVIRNARDLLPPVLGTDGGVVIPASPSALMKRQPDT